MEYLTHPFTIGLAIGLAVACIVYLRGIMKRRSVVKGNQTLREHLQTQMEISAKGNECTRKELEDIRKQNENLRITNANLKHKPGRAELHTLVLYDKAIHLMYARAPGFAPAWESILKEAEDELRQSDSGLVPLLRKVFRPSLGSSGGQSARLESGSALMKDAGNDDLTSPAG